MICVTALLVLASASSAQTEVTANAGWDAPTGGTPAVTYVVQLSTNDGAWQTIARPSTTEMTLTLTYLDDHRIRVAGVDAQGRQGAYSPPSETYNASGGASGPGQPGQPVLF